MQIVTLELRRRATGRRADGDSAVPQQDFRTALACREALQTKEAAMALAMTSVWNERRAHPRAPAEGTVLAYSAGDTTVLQLCNVSRRGALLVADLSARRRTISRTPPTVIHLTGPGVRSPLFTEEARVERWREQPRELAVLGVSIPEPSPGYLRFVERSLRQHVRRAPRREPSVLVLDTVGPRDEVLHARLELLGHRVAFAHTPLEAVHQLVNRGPYECIVVSSAFERTTGVDIVAFLEEEAPETRRILLSTPSAMSGRPRTRECEHCVFDWLLDADALRCLMR